ncbi:hypothetical protein LguiA_022732 [Lonicera macranthoides]
MSKFNVAWWAYSYTLTLLALASTEYAQASKTTASHVLMLFLSALSVVVPPVLLVFAALNAKVRSLPTQNHPTRCPNIKRKFEFC